MTTEGIIKKAKRTAKKLGDATKVQTMPGGTVELLKEARAAINALVGILETGRELATALTAEGRDDNGH